MNAASVRHRRLMPTAAIVLLAAVGALSGCSDDAPEATPEELRERLTAAKTQLDEAESVEFSLSTGELPDGEIGILEAEGVGTHAPAFKGTASVNVTGGDDVELIAVDDEVYVKLSFDNSFRTVDPADLGGPDPATLFNPETGVTSLLTSTDDLEAGEDSRDGETVLSTVTGTLPGDAVQILVPKAEESADFDVEYRITEDDALRDAVVTGPFYGDVGDVTYTMTFDASDEAVEITAP